MKGFLFMYLDFIRILIYYDIFIIHQPVFFLKQTTLKPPQFGRGYGLTFGKNERKAMSMAIIDRAMQYEDYGEECRYPVQNHEFILAHSDNVEASGFVSHLKLPHYVDFQSELSVIRRLKKKHMNKTRENNKDNGKRIDSEELSKQPV